jgi:hypothetical protein
LYKMKAARRCIYCVRRTLDNVQGMTF